MGLASCGLNCKPIITGVYSQITGKHDALTPTVWTIGSYCEDPTDDYVWISEISDNEEPNAIEYTDKNSQIVIYPNPTNDILNISSQDKLVNPTIQIIDVLGRVILTRNIVNTTAKLTVEIGHIVSGTYIVNIKTQNSNYAYKIQIVHN